MKVHAILDTINTAESVNEKIQEMLDATIFGCTESDACNYNPEAITDDGSCLENDCAGVCNGPGLTNTAGDGACCATGAIDCAHVCDGSAVVDMCGICSGNETDANNCLGIHYDITVANQFQIQRLYPNPFNPVLHINFNVAWSGVTQVNILDIAGSHIETLYFGFLQSGSHKMSWNAESMHSGIYFISLKSGDKSLIEKVVLLK